jgi:hypothetical protein
MIVSTALSEAGHNTVLGILLYRDKNKWYYSMTSPDDTGVITTKVEWALRSWIVEAIRLGTIRYIPARYANERL